MFYDRGTNEFFTVIPEENLDNYHDEDEAQNGPLLKEASRLARSVRVIHLCDLRHINSYSQALVEDGMGSESWGGVSVSSASQDSRPSASTARPKRAKRVIVPEPASSGQHYQEARYPTISEDALEYESNTEADSEDFKTTEEAGDNSNTGLGDHMSTGDGGASPRASGPQENGEVRTPISKDTPHVLTCLLESLCDVRRY